MQVSYIINALLYFLLSSKLSIGLLFSAVVMYLCGIWLSCAWIMISLQFNLMYLSTR